MRYRFAEFVLDTDSETVHGPDGEIVLRQRTFQLLCALLEQAPAVVSRDQILDQVWGHDALSPAVLAQTIGEIRQALGDNAQSPRLIETRYRRGYRIMVPVTQLADTPEQAPAAPADDDTSDVSAEPPQTVDGNPLSSNARQQRALPIWAALAALLLLVAGAFWWWPTARHGEPHTGTRPALAMMITASDDSPPWLADAGAEILTMALAHDQRLQLLRGEGRSAQARGNDLRWQTWMREVLGADYALTGIWRSDKQQLVINYTLLELDSGRVLHSGEARDSDLAALSRTVARQLRRHLRLIDGDQAWLAGLPAAEPARQAYYSGLAELAAARSGTAIELLSEAAADPQSGSRVRMALAQAYRSAGRMHEARTQFEELLGDAQTLALGERLRMEAELALVDYRPGDAAASLRALHRLLPDDGEIGLALVDAQILARQPRAAADTLASLEPLAARLSEDPRWHLAQARLRVLEDQLAPAAESALNARRLAERYGLDEIAAQAMLEQAQILRSNTELSAAREQLEQVLAGEHSRVILARARVQLGSLLRDQGEFDTAENLLHLAKDDFKERGDLASELLARIELHTIHSERGHSQRALDDLLELEDAILALGEVPLQARYYNTLGVQAVRNNSNEDAARYLQRAATESRRAGIPRQEAGALNNMAMILARTQRLDEAEAAWQQALSVFRDNGDRRGEAITLGNLGSVAEIRGQLPRSRDLNRQALVLMRELGANQDIARISFNLGITSEREGDLLEAEALVTESLAAYRAGDAGADFLLSVSAVLIRLQWASAQIERAEATLADALSVFDAAGSPVARGHLLTSQANLVRDRGDVEQARVLFQRARELRQPDTASGWSDMSELDLLALAMDHQGALEAAYAGAERIAERRARADDKRNEARARLVQARALIKLQQADRAVDVLSTLGTLLSEVSDAGMAFELDRLRILAAHEQESSRRARLNSLADEAERRGFHLFALRCRLEADPDDSALRDRVLALGLQGLLRDPGAS